MEWHILALVTLALTAFGIVMVYSATSAPAVVGGANPTSYLERQATYALLGIAGMLVLSRWNYARLRTLAPTLVVCSLVGCAAVLVLAHPINGARRWISFGPASFQPSEVAKLALAVWLAAYLTKRKPPVLVARALEADRRTARRLPRSPPARAGPRHVDHDRGDGRRSPLHVGDAPADPRRRISRSSQGLH